MVSKSFSFVMLLVIVQCRLACSVDSQWLGDPKQNTEIQPVWLSSVLSAFRRTAHEIVDLHLIFMIWVASYGDRLYNLHVNVSEQCWRTARANSLMVEKLAIGSEALNVMYEAVSSTTRDLKNRRELNEHPLEPVCRQIEKGYAENSNLSSSFEEARKDAAYFTSASRPPYFHKLISKEDMMLKIVEKSDIPEVSKLLAILSFRNVLNGERRLISDRSTVFARSCVAVAKIERFTDLMQRMFEETINDVRPEIMVNDRVEKYRSSVEYQKNDVPSWWISRMMKIFYSYIRRDPILWKKVDDMAPIVGQSFKKEDFDFSKL